MWFLVCFLFRIYNFMEYFIWGDITYDWCKNRLVIFSPNCNLQNIVIWDDIIWLSLGVKFWNFNFVTKCNEIYTKLNVWNENEWRKWIQRNVMKNGNDVNANEVSPNRGHRLINDLVHKRCHYSHNWYPYNYIFELECAATR